jgi:hypothetical protein
MLGEANNLYAFQKFEEAIKILEEVVTRMPELPEPLTTLSSIYGKLLQDLSFVQRRSVILRKV